MFPPNPPNTQTDHRMGYGYGNPHLNTNPPNTHRPQNGLWLWLWLW